MTIDKIISTTQLWFEQLWSAGDLEIADQIVDSAYAPEWVQIPAEGPEQVKHEVKYFRSIFPDLNYTIVDLATQDIKVWVRYQATGTHQGNAWGFEPTHKAVEFEGVTLLTFAPSGKIIDRWGAFCFYDIFTNLGLVPPWWELGQLQNQK